MTDIRNLDIDLTTEMRVLLGLIARDVVIVGGAARVARGEQEATKDLDLLLNPSNAAVTRTRLAIKESGLRFESPTREAWTFEDDVAGTQVEIATHFTEAGSYSRHTRGAESVDLGEGLRVRLSAIGG